MKREDAIQLWNSTARIAVGEDFYQTTHLGAAAIAAGAHQFCYQIPPEGSEAHEHNMRVVRFLRKWADRIESEGPGREDRLAVAEINADQLRKIVARKDEQERELVAANLNLNKDRIELREALEESLKLQSHYANLLNMHDGGKRIPFETVDKWLERRKEVQANQKKIQEESCK